MNPPEDIAAAVAANPAAQAFIARLLWFDTIGSTNDQASRLAEAGAAEGTIVAADAQTSGRGRQGRTWASPAGAGLYFALILRPQASMVPLLTIAAGVAVSDALQSATGLAVDLKWPNDVYCGGRKMAGILAERGDAHVTLGIGINVTGASYPPEIAMRATSLEAELGRQVDRALVFAECVSAFARRYEALRHGQDVIGDWRRRAASMLGRRVEFDEQGLVQRGVADDVDDTGALLVKTDTGSRRIVSGEVRWI